MRDAPLPAAQRDAFGARGLVHLPGFVDARSAAEIADRIWELLSRRGIDRAAPETWPAGRVTQLQAVAKAEPYGPFEAAFSPFADQILGVGSWTRVTPPGPLVTFPQSGPWVLPHQMWHFDLPARGTVDPPIALRLLGLVERVEPRGGGTIVVEGSHTLTERWVARASDGDAGKSRDVRRRLEREFGWFRELCSPGDDRERFFEESTVDGVTVRVRELVGEPGDAYLMHPWLLHGLAANTAPGIRSMLTHTVYGSGFRWVR